jgi:hypothetical protein
MTLAQISNTKTEIRRKGTRAKPQKPQKPQLQPKPPREAGIQLDDLLVLRGLLDRVGEAQLRKVIDVMGKG